MENAENLVKSLHNLLADTYALYLKTQNYHWNITGSNFKSLHSLLEEQYIDLAEAVDDIAERIRTLGYKVPATFSHFDSLKTIIDGNENSNATDMIKSIAADQDKICTILDTVAKEANAVGDDVTESMTQDRKAVHQKNKWMLESSI